MHLIVCILKTNMKHLEWLFKNFLGHQPLVGNHVMYNISIIIVAFRCFNRNRWILHLCFGDCCLISPSPLSLHPCMSFSGHLVRSLSSISLWMLGSDLWTGVCKFLTAKDCLMSSTAACGDGPTCTAITSCVPSRPASTPSTQEDEVCINPLPLPAGGDARYGNWQLNCLKHFGITCYLNEHSFTLSIERSFNHLNVRSCSSSSCP